MPHVGLFFAGFYLSALLTALGWNLLRALAASARLRRHRARARFDTACSDPTAVAFLIHGTWAPKAQWTRPDSPLCRRVEETLGGRIRFEPFVWSGRNRISARRDAAVRLRTALTVSLTQWPGVPHYIIAHSHGGNIALSALNSAALATRIAGVICLSTPFLHARRRDLGSISWIALSLAPAYLLLSLGQLLAIAVPSIRDPAVAVFGAVALVTPFMAPRVYRRLASRLEAAFVSTSMPPDRVLIIRTPGDEASAALGTAHFVSWLVGMTWSIPSRALSNAFSTVEQWNVALARHNALVTSSSLIALVAGFYLIVAVPFQSNTRWGSFGSVLISTAMTILAIRLKGGTYGLLLGILFAGMLVSPVPVILGLAALPISADLALAAILLEVTAESSPPGVWTVQQLGGAEFAANAIDPHSPRAGHVMMHSSSYEHPVALKTIAAWLKLKHESAEGIA